MKPTASAVANRRYSCFVSFNDIPFLGFKNTHNKKTKRFKHRKNQSSSVQARHFRFSQAFTKSPIRKPPEMNSGLSPPQKTRPRQTHLSQSTCWLYGHRSPCVLQDPTCCCIEPKHKHPRSLSNSSHAHAVPKTPSLPPPSSRQPKCLPVFQFHQHRKPAPLLPRRLIQSAWTKDNWTELHSLNMVLFEAFEFSIEAGGHEWHFRFCPSPHPSQ